MLPLVFFIISNVNTNVLFYNPKYYCEYSNRTDCINTPGCGWCNITNTDNTTLYCKYVGFCYKEDDTCATIYNKYECIGGNSIFICLIGLFFVSISYTFLLSTSRCIERSNFHKYTISFIRTISLIIIILPLILGYLYNYTVFAAALFIETGLTIIFWCLYGSKIIKQFNNPGYESINASYGSI